MKMSSKHALAAGTALLMWAHPAQSIMIRHDVTDADYVVAPSEFPAVVILFPPDDCVATLIHASFLLTVAHCAVDLDAGHFLTVDGSSFEVSQVVLHPDWRDSRDEYDIALVRLRDPVTSVSPVPIYRGTNEIGALVTLVGAGLTGSGLEGEKQATSDGQLRRATNIVTAVDEHWLQLVFDEDEFSGGTSLEGIGASGDSGAPALIDISGTVAVAGLNSFGEGCDGVNVGQYAAFDYQTRVSQYLTWLDGVGDFASAGDSDIGDPNANSEFDFCFGCASNRTDLLGALGCFAVLVALRPRRRQD